MEMFVGKKVLEIGCGHGLLGVLAKKLGAAEVCFQDYNQSVIEGLTRQTVELNCGSLENVEFCSFVKTVSTFFSLKRSDSGSQRIRIHNT